MSGRDGLPRPLGWLLRDNVAGADMIVHVGAGACHELDHYLAIEAESIVLIEPHHETAKDLRRRADVEVIEAAVTTEDGEAPLHVTNDPRFCAMTDPAPLQNFYPGLRLLDSRPVATLTFSSLVGRLEPAAERDNLLVCEMLGVDESVIAGAEPRDLKRFRRIVVRALQIDGPPGRDRIRSGLEEAGYGVVKVAEAATPFVLYYAEKNPQEVLFDSEAASRLGELERTVSEYQHRQGLTTIELARARSQIELLKDLLIGDH